VEVHGVSSFYEDERASNNIFGDRLAIVNNHAWALPFWLRKLSLHKYKTVNLVHVDYHSDLGAPYLYQKKSSRYLTDYFTGRDIDFSNINSVEAAISSGAIPPGGFIAPFLLEYPNTNVYSVFPVEPNLPNTLELLDVWILDN